MQNAQVFRTQILDMLSILPLESLRTLAKFTEFLHYTHKEETMPANDNIVHFDVIQPQNPSISGPRLAYPEQFIYFEKEMEILDEDAQI